MSEALTQIQMDDICKVTLTGIGHRRYFEYKIECQRSVLEMDRDFKEHNTNDKFQLKLDEYGKAKFSLKDLMHIFGKYYHIETDDLFENGIIEIEKAK
jgi:hypothetical protein